MNVVKSLWAMVQGDPVFMRRVNGWFTIFWIVMIPISMVTGWISSVTYVSVLSLWALVSGHWSAWEAARVEVKQDEEMAANDAVKDDDNSKASRNSRARVPKTASRPDGGAAAVRRASSRPRPRIGTAARMQQITR